MFNYFKLLKKERSITLIISVSLFAILIIQSVFLFINFMLFGSMDKLEQITYSYILSKSDKKAKELETLIVDHWSSSQYFKQIINTANKIYDNNTKNNIPVNINTDIADQLVSMVNFMRIDGAFLIMDNKINENTKNIFHINDSDLNINIVDKSDISVAVGSEKISQKLDISLESSWTPYINSNNINKVDYDNIIKRALKSSKEDTHIGFWYISQINPDDMNKSMYFIRPMMKNGHLYALLGINVRASTIKNLFSYKDFADSNKNAYALISSECVDDNVKYTTICVDGHYVENLFKTKQVNIKKIPNKYYNESRKIKDLSYLYELKGENLIAIPRDVRLYKEQKEDPNIKLTLLTITDINSVKMYSNQFMSTLLKVSMFTLLIGFALSFFISKYIGKPINALSNKITNIYQKNEEGISEIPKINIKELDNLTYIVEKMSSKLLENSKKFENILSNLPVSIVAIEKIENEDYVYKLGDISSILEGYNDIYKFSDKIHIKNYDILNEKLFSSAKLVDSVYDVEQDTQIDVYEKTWNKKVRYFKIITKITESSDIDANTENINNNTKTLTLITDVTKDMKEKLKIKKERDYDSLTGLLNRLSFKERVTKIIENDINKKRKFAMIMWDLDDLKYINDSYGHDIGDSYLKLAALNINTLKHDNGLISRLSGDEFFAFIEYKNDKSEIIKRVENLQKMMDTSTLSVDTYNLQKIRATTGICFYPDDANNFSDLCKYADFAMYTAKNSAKGSIAEFDKNLYKQNYILLSGKGALNKFIEDRELRYAFQPIVSAVDGSIYSYEALMRPTSSFINNVGDVFRLAKTQSKLSDIERITFEEVLKYVSINLENFKGKKIFINSIASAKLSNKVFDYLALNYSHILKDTVMEIIESEDLDNKVLSEKINFIEKYGGKIAVDDYGTGYATETWLLKIRPHFIKIDMELVKNIDKDTNKQTMVQNVIQYAKNNNIKIIAEGIETHEEMSYLVDKGVDYLQGYYIARPDFEIKDIPQQIKRDIQVLQSLKNLNSIIKDISPNE